MGVVLLGSSTPASAHATLLFTTPAANGATATSPKVIQLVFDERVIAADSAITITGASSTTATVTRIQQIDATTLRGDVQSTLSPGTYGVSWEAGADDGDLMSGGFEFVVGDSSSLSNGSGPTRASDSPVTAISRWVQWLALAMSLGGIIGQRLVRRVDHPLAKTAGLRTTRRALVVGILASAVGLVAYATAGGDTGRGLGDITASTPGRVLLTEVAAFTVATMLARLQSTLLVGLTLLIVPIAEGFRAHPAAASTWGVLFTAVHLVAVAIWLGALAKVIAVSRALRREGQSAGPVFTDYSRWAIVAFAVIVASGIASSLSITSVDTFFSSLGRTTWGTYMLVKLVLVALVAAMALAARHFLRKRRLSPTLRISRFEIVALAVVIGLSALMTTSAPPNAQAATLAAAPPAIGPTVSAGTRTGEVGIGVIASDGQIVIRLNAPSRDSSSVRGTAAQFSLKAALTTSDTSQARQLNTTRCGTGCFVAAANLSAGVNVVTLAVTSPDWVGGSGAVAISWPHTTGRENLVKVVDELRRTPRLTLFEKVTSNTRRPGPPADSFTLSGDEFLNSEPYGNGKAPEVSTYVGRSTTTLSLAYPSEGIYVSLTLDAENRIIRESIASGKHLVLRAFRYGR